MAFKMKGPSLYASPVKQTEDKSRDSHKSQESFTGSDFDKAKANYDNKNKKTGYSFMNEKDWSTLSKEKKKQFLE